MRNAIYTIDSELTARPPACGLCLWPVLLLFSCYARQHNFITQSSRTNTVVCTSMRSLINKVNWPWYVAANGVEIKSVAL
eukprot:8530865-Lingulodinium_polyedra.AAC.1